MSCRCDDPGCSHLVLADAIREASNLTDLERVTILKVLGRDELLRREQEVKVMHLKAELQNLRRKGALRPSTDWEKAGPDPDRCCGRCRVELGRVINRGAYCRACRLKVCKGCREYSYRTTDWVCTVCHKRMEIQATSGEWMNEFVRRPSRRRDNRVYVPAADVIKRTIRRSWTISNPSSRWNAPRTTPEMRLYNSLPRGQDITNYPSLQHQQADSKTSPLTVNCTSPKRHSPARRTHSEDVYPDRTDKENASIPPTDTAESSPSKSPTPSSQRSPRINPLILYAQKDRTNRTGRKKKGDLTKADTVCEGLISCQKGEGNEDGGKVEKRVSFDSCARDLEDMPPRSPKNINPHINRTSSLSDTPSRIPRRSPQHLQATRSLQERSATDEYSNIARNSASSPETSSSGGTAGNRDEKEFVPLELCDIEPLSGTVFRKVTVRRRRQDMRKMAAVDSGWRRTDSDLVDILTPDNDEYKLVFISSDSSSKEEDVDDNDSSSTASSFPIEECDWDYFEPSAVARPVLSWNSPFSSPRVYRRGLIESPIGSPLVYRKSIRESDTGTDDDYARIDTGSPASSDSIYACKRDSEEGSNEVEKVMDDVALKCKHKTEVEQRQQVPPCRSCGSSTQYIPIPVPVPIPVPIPTMWTAQEAMKFYAAQQQQQLGGEQALARLRIFPRNLWPFLNSAALVWPLVGNAGDTVPSQTSDRTPPTVVERAVVPNADYEAVTSMEMDQGDACTLASQHVPQDDGEVSGYLESENRYADSSSSSTETDDSEYNERRKSCVTRVYNVNGRDGARESDDALPSSNLSSCDEEDGRASQNSIREDLTSSCTSDTDSDDTGTDQKSKKFSKVFVVNKNMDSSSSQRSSSSDSDSSDNDTDTELDCTVILQNIKYLPDANDQVKPTESDCVPQVPNPTDIEAKDKPDNKESIDNVKVQYPPGETDDAGANKQEEQDEAKTEASTSSSVNLSDLLSTSRTPSDLEYDPAERADLEHDGASGTVSSDRNGSEIRSGGAVGVVGEFVQEKSPSSCCGSARASAPGVSVTLEPTEGTVAGRNAARYTSLVMITQEPASALTARSPYQQVSVVTSDTTVFVPDNDVIVQHTNWQEEEGGGFEDAPSDHLHRSENVTVITGAETLSAFEEGLADDDSWVESHDEDDFGPSSITEDSSSGEEVTLTCSVAVDNEDELRGYHRAAIDFTLHTIVEESCEESEVEQTCSIKKQRPASATDLEKYFFFGLGDGNTPSINNNREDAFSETSSVYSEGLDSFGGPEEQQQNDHTDPAELASSRLEKYFLSGFMGFDSGRRDSDGSVGSDSEGRPSPEQRRKRLVRARGTGRSHSSSLDNLLSNPELSGNDQPNEASNDSENTSSSDSDTYDETTTFEKSDGQFDTVKRKKNKKQKATDDLKSLETTQEVNEFNQSGEEDEDGHKTPQPENLTTNLVNNKNQQSRDSGFIGSCDDLLKEQRDTSNNENISKNELKKELENIIEEKKEDRSFQQSVPPATSLTRKDSFNNWSSDEETNLMMCKMRQFFKTMIANSQCPSSKPSTPNMSNRTSPIFPSPRLRNRCKPPQLVYFENELTRLMKTVPGIRDDQVREIVEYLSSEDTWSDSYDSSDYTSSDLEGTTSKTALQQQISDSCKQIINKFDNLEDEEGDEGDGGIVSENLGVNKETSFVYQKLVASFERMASGDNDQEIPKSPNSSPTLIARVMHHIGSRLVALMHEVSSGESHASNSPKARHYHRRLQQKLSNASSTTTDDDSTSDTNLKDTLSALEDNFSYTVLPRSKSHDLLMGESKTSNPTGSGDIVVEEREASDCERFSWRGSFESALLATDSRNRLSMIGSEGSASASALAIAAKRRSAGDLIFSHKSLSREQLDRVRSCGSIGGASSEDKLWVSTATRPNRRRSSVPDASCGSGGSADGEDDDEEDIGSSLPRNLQTGAGTTNSLPRLPTTTPPSSMHKAQSHHFLPQNAKSARYRPPGFNRPNATVPKRAVSAPGLQPSHQRRGRRSQQNVPSETTKRLIKPNSQDGLTEADLYAFDRAFYDGDSDESPRKPGKQLFVTEFDIELDEAPDMNEKQDLEDLIIEETNLDKEDEVSVLTDDTSVSGGDGSAKKKTKKKIRNILKIGRRKKKNKDGTSVTSSATSLACSEISENPEGLQNMEAERTIIEGGEVTHSLDKDAKKDEVSHDETDKLAGSNGNERGGLIVRRLQSIFSSMRLKKGKKNVDSSVQPLHKTNEDPAPTESKIKEGHPYKIAKIIPLGSKPPSKTEVIIDGTSPQELEINLQKKPFWKPFSKKNKNKETLVADKEVIDGIKLDCTNPDKPIAEKDGQIEVGTDATTIYGVNKVTDELPNIDSKKKTLFGTLKLTRKDGQQNSQQIPCLFTACVNSNIKPETGRKGSTGSVEVKTIADDELENDEKVIKIVRNDFFPAEVRTNDDHLVGTNGSLDGVAVVGNVRQEFLDENIERDQDVPEDTETVKIDEYEEIEKDENVSEDKSEEENDQLHDSSASEKKYGVFEKEDFSESLHTLVDEEDGDHILLAPTSALLDSPIADNATPEKIDGNNLSEGIFRTSCNLSIEASEQFIEKFKEGEANIEREPEAEAISNQEEPKAGTEIETLEEKVVDESKLIKQEVAAATLEAKLLVENITASSDTLTESRLNVSIIEKSTETLKTTDKGSVASSWIDVANVDDISESKFNYIYRTTLQMVKTGGVSLVEELSGADKKMGVSSEGNCEDKDDTRESDSKGNEAGSKSLENSCEFCGKSIKEEAPEDLVNERNEAKCICTTLTKPRPSLTEIEEGSVKSKVKAFNESKNPIMFPLACVEVVKKDEVTISEAHSSPTLGSKSKSATPSPIAAKSRSGTLSSTNSEWQHAEEDIDRMIQGRGSLSGLGLRSDSMASVYSGAGEGRYGTVAVRGQVEFGLQYNYKAGALEIHVKQCKDLAPVDAKRNRSDPYVKVYLLPDKSKGGKRKTKVKKHTLNPVFDETLKFHISLNGLETRTLWLTVWHSDMFGRNDFLGEVMMTLENKVFDDPAPVWYNLQERTEPFDDTISFKGDIIVCLKFVPPDMTVQKKGKRSRGTLHVLVKEAKYLTAYKANGTSDPFCKSYLLPDKGRNSKQKTPVVKKTVNPVWNHTFIYEDVTLQELAERCLELTVWDHDRLASNEFLGGVRFSLGTGKHYGKPVEWMDATGKELTLWKSMLERPNFWVEGCLSLRPSLDSRTS